MVLEGDEFGCGDGVEGDESEEQKMTMMTPMIWRTL
jgi:hypothetical protein